MDLISQKGLKMSLKSGVTPESGIWSLESLRSMESGVTPESGFWSHSVNSGWEVEIISFIVRRGAVSISRCIPVISVGRRSIAEQYEESCERGFLVYSKTSFQCGKDSSAIECYSYSWTEKVSVSSIIIIRWSETETAEEPEDPNFAR